ncbi:MAG: hypothetical protein LBQ73_06310 [Tannerellaceae bacterium]|jgi:hypothetical protein|nr:hypothetical protein [Tannerellaceae bacterium]
MKKVLLVLTIFMMALQVAFAQGRVVTIYFHNGSVIKGEISKLPNEERFRIQTPNGSVFLFTSSEVRDILYEDGTRPGANNQSQYRPQPQPNRSYVPQQTQPPGNQAIQPQQSYPQNQNRVAQQPAQTQPRNNQVVHIEPEEEIIEEDVYDDDYDLMAEDEPSEPVQPVAQTPKTTNFSDFVPGYHGFVDFGYTIGMGDSLHAFNRMELTITQGYQFTPSLFAGLGFGVHLYGDSIPISKIVDNAAVVSSLSYAFPIFVDFRYNFSDGKIRPFAALKGGYSIGLHQTYSTRIDESGRELRRTETSAEALGFYVAPSVGVKFMLGRSMAFNVGAGYSMQLYTNETLGTGTIIKKMDILGGVTLKAGLEF